MEAFVQVVETGSFTAAAAKMQSAKSSVSDAVRGLEERLGVRLLDRTTRRVRPTEAGERLYLRCRRILNEARDARAEARAFQEAPSGKLRVEVPDGFIERFLLPGLPGFLERFPSVSVEIISGIAQRHLVDDDFDLAIRILDSLTPQLVARRIGTARIVIVASPSYLMTNGSPKEPADVLRHRCITIAPPQPWSERWQIGEQTVPIRPVVVLNTAEALRVAALSGMGLVALPEWMVTDSLAAGQLVALFPTHAPSQSGIFSVYPSNRLLTPLVRLFVDRVAASLRLHGRIGNLE